MRYIPHSHTSLNLANTIMEICHERSISELIDDLISVLEPFEYVTELMSGSSYVTSSMILPAATLLLEILQITESQFGYISIKDMCLSMFDQLTDLTDPYFRDPILMAASFLDPR